MRPTKSTLALLAALLLALLTLALSIPGLNVVTGAALVVKLLYSGAGAVRSLSARG